MDFQFFILIFLSSLSLFLLIKFLLLKSTIESNTRKLFDEWTAVELNRLKSEMKEQMLREATVLSERWIIEKETEVRKDAIERSKNVIKGKVTEHLLPFFADFPYNPMDARFLGSPVDLVVFDGLSEGKVKQVVFLEIKTGKWANLSEREKQVRQCIDAGNVEYKVLRQAEAEALVD